VPLSTSDCEAIRRALEGKATGYRYSDVARWLQRAGFEPPRKAEGSHRVWYHARGRRVQLVEKGHGEMLPAYVKNAARILLEMELCR
jgi:predicted RNA binding protein YcfA (HicA-like mRNA interferase family)